MKSSTSPAILIDPFPNQETHLVSRDPTSSNLVSILSSTKSKVDVMVTTHNKYYGNENSPNDQHTDQPTNSVALHQILPLLQFPQN